jgi:hypothetical protein
MSNHEVDTVCMVRHGISETTKDKIEIHLFCCTVAATILKYKDITK